MLEALSLYFSQAPEFGWNAFWVSQGCILIALICDITSYQMKTREHIIYFLAISTFLIAAHLALLNQPVAALLMCVAGFRFLVSAFTTKKFIMLLFMILSTTITALLYQSWLDIWILFGGYFFTLASFQKTDKTLREIMMCGTSMMILYAIFIFSPAAVLLESLFLGSNVVGYYRYYLKPHKT